MKRKCDGSAVAPGLWYRVAPHFAQNMLAKVKSQVGKVVYVHPKGRFATLEFPGEKGKPRECFFPEQLNCPALPPRENCT